MARFQTGPRPEFRWDGRLRQLLCCMERFFVIPPRDFGTIFSQISQNMLITGHFGGPVDKEVKIKVDVTYDYLHSEWLSMKRRDSSIWHHVHTQTSFRRDGEWKLLISIIQSTANALKIPIALRNCEPFGIKPCYGRRFDGEYLESILLASPSQASSASTEIVGLASSSTSSDPLPVQDTIEEQDYIEVSDKLSDTHSLSDNQPLVFVHGKKCIWCEWEKLVENNQDMGTSCASHQLVSTEANLNPIADEPDLCTQMSYIDESPEYPVIASTISEINSWERPGRISPEELPPLLFRWWNKDSQGLNTKNMILSGARIMQSPEWGFQPDGMGREEFLRAFKNHVNQKHVPSPFISTSQSPLSPIHRALVRQEDAVVAVIDPAKLGTNASVFKSTPLVEITNTALKNWKGYGEYLVWEAIPSAAIVFTFEINTLEQIAHDNPVIGAFLQLRLIKSARNCTRFLYSRIATALQGHSEYDIEVALTRLMELLEIPEDYWGSICGAFKRSWLMGTPGIVYEKQDWSQSEASGNDNDKDVQPIDFPIYLLPYTPPDRIIPGFQSDKSYNPSRDGEDSTDCDSSEEEEQTQGSQSPEARCPRRDTPSSGFSVQDESDGDLCGGVNRDKKRRRTIFRCDRPIPINFADRDEVRETPEVSDSEQED